MRLPEDISRQLATTYGLDPCHYGGPGLAQAVQLRREACGKNSDEAYFQHLRVSEDELAALVDELLIPESWFFRDRVPFVHLMKWIKEVWQPANCGGERCLRVLSLPCAAGQEAWSLAITLLEAGLDPSRFSILAGDLSRRFLDQAMAGHYRQIAFRGDAFCDRNKYFEDAGDGCMRIGEAIRPLVTFRKLNLLEPPGYQAFGPYDVIFCRNVLIYFDDHSRRLAFEGLTRCLHPEGLLFVGHADSLQRISREFVRSGPAGAFCYVRSPEKRDGLPVPQAEKATSRLAEKPRFASAPGSRVKGKTTGIFVKNASNSTDSFAREVPPPRREVNPWEEARRLADAGQLAQAEALCRKGLETTPGSAGLLFLLGEILLGQKKTAESEAQFRRVVYLDPKHGSALFRLAMLAEQRGDYREASSWRRRALRETKADEAVLNHD